MTAEEDVSELALMEYGIQPMELASFAHVEVIERQTKGFLVRATPRSPVFSS